MRLSDLGLTEELALYISEQVSPDLTVGRVTQEHRERYVVSDGMNEYDAEITGNMRFSAASREDYPAVGDWVAMTTYDSDQAVINRILPRKTVLARQAVGKPGERQIISTNLDCAFIVQAINNNFNVNRLERYLTICYSAGIEPVLVLSKTDLVTGKEITDAVNVLERRDREVKYILLSNITREGVSRVTDLIQPGMTYCVIGSSGVGKSTLINTLLKREALRTGEISSSTNKGKHVTEHRQLFVLEGGGIIIDTPGMKEIGMTDTEAGVRITFGDISDLAEECRFPDCKHISEAGCAVLKALGSGDLDKDSYENYLKMTREQEHFLATVAEKRKRDRQFGKMIKEYHREKRKSDPE